MAACVFGPMSPSSASRIAGPPSSGGVEFKNACTSWTSAFLLVPPFPTEPTIGLSVASLLQKKHFLCDECATSDITISPQSKRAAERATCERAILSTAGRDLEAALDAAGKRALEVDLRSRFCGLARPVNRAPEVALHEQAELGHRCPGLVDQLQDVAGIRGTAHRELYGRADRLEIKHRLDAPLEAKAHGRNRVELERPDFLDGSRHGAKDRPTERKRLRQVIEEPHDLVETARRRIDRIVPNRHRRQEAHRLARWCQHRNA